MCMPLCINAVGRNNLQRKHYTVYGNTLQLSRHCIFRNNMKMCWLRTLYAFSYFYENFIFHFVNQLFVIFLSFHCTDRLSYIFAVQRKKKYKKNYEYNPSPPPIPSIYMQFYVALKTFLLSTYTAHSYLDKLMHKPN